MQQLDIAQTRKVYTVSEITRLVRFTLEDRFGSVWVEGEISNFTHPASGHMYFSIKDSEASLQCAMFRMDNSKLRFKPESGLKVICRGRVSVYPPRGQYQLVVEQLEPQGVGELQIAFEQLKKKLAEEGLFDLSCKKRIPHLPTRIGLVTSLTGAVIHDVMRVIERRFPTVNLVVSPVQVQGEAAKFEIVRAIRDLNDYGEVDVLVLARGGGSLEDLWPFNEEIVARAIAASSIPVVSAVGHEVDYTIADFVADLRAPTPSAAAEILLPVREELLSEVGNLKKYLHKAVSDRIDGYRNGLFALLESRSFRNPRELLVERYQRLDEVTRNLKNGMSRVLDLSKERFVTKSECLEALSPLACLRRGYGITFDHRTSRIVKSVKKVSRNQRLRTRLADGTFLSRVEGIEKES